MTQKQGELDWFDFETRMRKLIIDLIQPTVLKMNEDRESNSKLWSFAEYQKERLDDMENLLLKCGKKNSVIDEIYEKITEIEKERKISQLKTEEDAKAVRAQIDMIDYKVDQKLLVASTIELQNKKLEETIRKFEIKMGEQKMSLSQEVVRMTEMIAKYQTISKDTLKQLEDKVSNYAIQLGSTSERLQNLEKTVEEQQAKLVTLNGNLVDISQDTARREEFESFSKEINKCLRIIETKLDETENNVATIGNYVEKYVPFHYHKAIHEALEFIMKDDYKIKREKYFPRIYRAIHHKILNTAGKTNIKQKIEELDKLLTDTRYEDLDLPANSARYEKIKSSENELPVSVLYELDPEITQKKVEECLDPTEIDILMSQFDSKFKYMANQISVKVHEQRSRLESRSEEIQLYLQNAHIELQNYIKKIRQERMESISQIKDLGDSLESIQKTVSVLHSSLNFILTIVMMKLEEDSIGIAQEVQALHDAEREPGFPATIKRLEASVAFPHSRMNRANGPRHSNLPFSYEPSAALESAIEKCAPHCLVQYRSKFYDTIELLRVRKAIIERCKEIVQSSIKLEEPITFAKFFYEGLSDAGIKSGDAGYSPERVPQPPSERVKTRTRIRPSKPISSDRKIRTRVINLEQSVMLDKDSQFYFATPNVQNCEKSIKFPSIDTAK